MKKTGFTLAEVLITLGIIGVVATMTIPTLMLNTQNNEFKAKMKKEYSVLGQAQQQIIGENGGNFINATGSCQSQVPCLKELFKQKIPYIKECDTNDGANLGICFPLRSSIKFLNGNATTDGFTTNIESGITSGFISKDGTAFSFVTESMSCTSTSNPGFSNKCGAVVVDVNGLKAPNTWGKDIYAFVINSDSIRPYYNNAGYSDDCGVGGNTGLKCSTKYLTGGSAN